MKSIIKSTLLILFFALLLIGCNTTTADKTNNEIREIAYNWLDDTIKSEIINSDTATIGKVIFASEYFVATKTKSMDIRNIETFRVIFNTSKDDLLGYIVVYLEEDTLNVLGMDYRE